MSPEALESYNNYENKNVGNERYLDIERGDVDPMNLQQNHAQNQFSQPTQQNTQAQQTFDPVMFVKNMISTGFTPTRAQIANATVNIGGSDDSTDKWFAIFLQKLLRQAKAKKSRG